MNRAERRLQRKKTEKAAKNVKSVRSASPSPGQQVLTIQQSLDLAMQHHNAGRLPEAESIYQQILQADPSQPVALHLLGVISHQMGKNDVAVDLITRAVAIKPDYAEAHNNLGNALRELGKLDEAVASYHKALAIKPEYAEAHSNLGTVLVRLGRFSQAKAAFDGGFHINHGGPWYNATTFAHGDSADKVPPTAEIFTSTFKLLDTIDQLEYLIAKGRIDSSFQRMADHYCAVLSEIQQMEKPEAVIKLTPGQVKRIGSFYNRAIYHDPPSRIDASTINGALDFKQIENRYLSSPVSVTTLDDFLTPKALCRLRDFCLESMIFYTQTDDNFVSSRLSSGFNCDLLFQIAEEVKERFPRILGDHELNNMWIYRYNNQGAGVAAHTDEGAVTFNFWITPDNANLIPGHGGIIVYTKDQPYDWDWRHYNFNKYTLVVSREIAGFLADADTVNIPYRENRAVLFHSNLFHKSDQIHFKDGFENRRMNITFLFGKRQG